MSGSELQVMVVEDHGFQRRIALRLLSELGIERVLEGSDGLHALDVLRKQATPPDVVLVDLDMPGWTASNASATSPRNAWRVRWWWSAR